MVRVREKGPSGDTLLGFSGQIGVPQSTLNDRAKGGKSRRKARGKEQILPPAIENALGIWVQKMEDYGFPPRFDIFKVMAQELAEQNAEQKGEDLAGKLSQPSLQCFLEVRIQSGPSTFIGR